MSLQTYAVYTRCSHCGIYDRDLRWCALCARPKDGSAGRANGVAVNGNGTSNAVRVVPVLPPPPGRRAKKIGRQPSAISRQPS